MGREIYENCRWCSNYYNGKCQADFYEIECDGSLVDTIELIEQGYLHECISETVESLGWTALEKTINSILSSNRIGEKRREEIISEIRDCMKDFKANLMYEMNNGIEKLLDGRVIDLDENLHLTIKNDSEFYCKEYR